MTKRKVPIITYTPTWYRRAEIPIDGQPSKSLDANAEFADFEKAVVHELRARELKKRRNSSELKQPGGGLWLRQTCYNIILSWLANDRYHEMLERLEEYGRFKRGTPVVDRDVFQDGIVALFAANPQYLTGDRKRFTGPMWYAFRHYIPPALLAGFNQQYPCYNKKGESWREFIEPALEDWVFEQRVRSLSARDPLDEFRGLYPTMAERVDRNVAVIERSAGVR